MKEGGRLINSSGREWILQGAEWTLIGRFSEKGKGISINHPTVSKLHARVRDMDGFELQDMNSKNGTFVNGVQLKNGEKRKLKEGDRIRFGEQEFRFECGLRTGRLPDIFGMKRDCFFTINGKKQRFILPDSEIISYQLRMMNENRELSVPECYFVQSIEENALLFDVTELISLKELLEQRKIDWYGLLELSRRITELVWIGLQHMLDKDQYAISEETIFLTSLHNDNKNIQWNEMKIIYFPKRLDQQPGFAEQLSKLVRLISEGIICSQENRKALLDVIKRFGGEVELLLRELIFLEGEEGEALRQMENIVSELQVLEKKKKIPDFGNIQDALSFLDTWKFALASFLLFMIAFFTELLNVTELCGFGVALVGFNAFMMLREESEKEE